MPLRQVPARQEGIVAGVQHQGRHGDVVQHVLGAGAVPVVVGVAVAVQRRGDDVVEAVQVGRCEQGGAVEQAGKALQLGQGLGLERFQEHARVQAVEAARQRRAAGRQVERGGDGHGGIDDLGAMLLLAQPAQQGIAAQRDAGHVEGTGKARAQAADDPVELFGVARMVEARRQVGFARAAAEMRDRAMPAARRTSAIRPRA
jgi:hypothetical protein